MASQIEHDSPRRGGVHYRPGEDLDPSLEEAYWRATYRSRSYADDSMPFDLYRPAYQYGWEARVLFRRSRWEDVEGLLERGWRRFGAASALGWATARLAVRDAWQRIDRVLADDALPRES
jgi:hypothetical protein